MRSCFSLVVTGLLSVGCATQKAEQCPCRAATAGAPAIAPQPIGTPSGEWHWWNGGLVTLEVDGSIRKSTMVMGTWHTVDEATRTIDVRWEGGQIDTLTMSPDGHQLSGTNQYGVAISATR